jgi:hypothetical protein
LRTEPPGKAQVIAMPVHLAFKGEAAAGKALLHRADQLGDLGVPGALHQRIGIGGVWRPILGEKHAPPVGVGFVPEHDVMGGEVEWVGHISLQG